MSAVAGGGRPTAFIVFSDDWGVHPSSSQHLFRHIAAEYDVAWINTVGMRRPRLAWSDAGKAVRKLRAMFRRRNAPGNSAADLQLRVYSPRMIPFNDIPALRRWNARSVRRLLRSIGREYEGYAFIVVTTVPNSCDYVNAVPADRVVYYCVDDFSEWPGLDKTLVLDMERSLIEESDVFVATSPALQSRLQASGKPTFLLSHGVDVELFAQEAASEHPVLADIPAPRVGYFGLFDERSDQALIADVARRLPDVSFVIAGNVELARNKLTSIGNVHFTGPVPYAELPQLVKGLRLLFIPYLVNRLTEALSPLKFKEYLATGRPVLCTPISAAGEFEDFVTVSQSADDWCARIESVLGDAGGAVASEPRYDLRGESWADKSREFLRICTGGAGHGPDRPDTAGDSN